MTIMAPCPQPISALRRQHGDAGWEFMGHGFRQIATHLVEDQRAMIRERSSHCARLLATRSSLARAGLTETLETPDLLAEAGIRYWRTG